MGLLDKLKEAKKTSEEDKGSKKTSNKEKETSKKSGGLFGSKSKKPKAQKKKKLSEHMGIKAEEKPSQQELVNEHTNSKIKEVWVYLRKELDDGAAAYFASGDSGKLENVLDPKLLSDTTSKIDELKAQGIKWVQPDRKLNTSAKVTVLDAKLNMKTKQPTQFVVEEHFMDFSEYSKDGQVIAKSDGEQRDITAIVNVTGGSKFSIASLTRSATSSD